MKLTDIERIALQNGVAIWDILSEKVRWYGTAIPNHDPVGFAEDIAEFVTDSIVNLSLLKDAQQELWSAWSDIVEEYGADEARTDHLAVYKAWKRLAEITTGEAAKGPTLEEDVWNIVSMLEQGEWAEHVAGTELGKRLERAITALG